MTDLKGRDFSRIPFKSNPCLIPLFPIASNIQDLFSILVSVSQITIGFNGGSSTFSISGS
uniref:Uncharacterized protein n=1 Tax=Solanum tuberosum TaxID=4113 RepID=M1BVN2_SOLTU